MGVLKSYLTQEQIRHAFPQPIAMVERLLTSWPAHDSTSTLGILPGKHDCLQFREERGYLYFGITNGHETMRNLQFKDMFFKKKKTKYNLKVV